MRWGASAWEILEPKGGPKMKTKESIDSDNRKQTEAEFHNWLREGTDAQFWTPERDDEYENDPK